MEEKLKVVWICSVSNPRLRSFLDLGRKWWQKIFENITKRRVNEKPIDYAQWNTNAISEFENINDVDLHVIFVHPMMKKKEQRFKNKGISFYAINDGGFSLINHIKQRLGIWKSSYEGVWIHISTIVKEVNPQIVHVMGAENPPYSLSVTKIEKEIPIIVQLQTVLHEPIIIQQYPHLKTQKVCEKIVVERANYIGASSPKFPTLIRQYVKPDAVIVNSSLIVAEKGDLGLCEKIYDFVYFSSKVNKAIDLVIEAFGLAHQVRNDLSLEIIGEVSNDDWFFLNKRLDELGIRESVSIEGSQATHEEVITKVRKARFALLPLKTDHISSTIREAIWNGLPVITTITQGTPLLNEKRESVLLSEIGDHASMASNMLNIATDQKLEETLRLNAITTLEEIYGNNAERAKEWVEIYQACVDNFYLGTPIPKSLLING